MLTVENATGKHCAKLEHRRVEIHFQHLLGALCIHQGHSQHKPGVVALDDLNGHRLTRQTHPVHTLHPRGGVDG